MTTWNTKVHTDANGDRIAVESGGQIDFKHGSRLRSGTRLAGNITAPTGWTLRQRPPIGTFFFAAAESAFTINFTDNGSNGGNASIDLQLSPGGVYLIQSVRYSGLLTGTSGLTSSAAVVGSIGTTAAASDNATLTGTEANILPSFNIGLTANLGAISQDQVTSVIIDTLASGSIFLNFAVPDAGISANATATFVGSIAMLMQRID